MSGGVRCCPASGCGQPVGSRRREGGDLTAAVLTATGAPDLAGRPSWPQVVAGRLRAGLQAACHPLPAEPGGLLPGLVIGDTSRLDPGLAEEFRATGLTHLVAVSGANVAIVLGVVLFVVRRCRAGPWLCAVVCGVALLGFVILARPSPSVVRAAAMGAVGLLALVAGRNRIGGTSPGGGRRLPAWSTIRRWPSMRVSRCRCWPRAGWCCWRRAGGTGCGRAACRPGWPRRWRCRRRPRWRVVR